MMKKNKMMQDAVKVGVIAALATVGMPDILMAATTNGDLGATTQNFAKNELASIPTLISSGCYIMGIIMMVGGALKLRQHTENPGQTPLSHGLGRLGVGGAIAALPSLASWVNASTQISGTALSNSSFTVNF